MKMRCFGAIASIFAALSCTAFAAGSKTSCGTKLVRPVAISIAMQSALQLADKVAKTNSTVLIQGETGTGKEVIAKYIHQKSPRRDGPFIAVNCGAIPENLIESELFGHARGSFTGANTAHQGLIAAADGGTLFLDEIGDLPLHLQVKLLRVIQERQIRPVGSVRSQSVNIRIISATHKDLAEEVSLGRFRQDLLFRLSVIPIKIAPLRQRLEEIEPLARQYLQTLSNEGSEISTQLSAPVLSALRRHSWPGNIRELQNTLERAAALAGKEPIQVADLLLPGSKVEKVQANAQLQPQSYSSADGSQPSSDVELPVPNSAWSIANRIARTNVSVLINGETGTGKEFLARHIHEKSGRKGPFVAINCGALPEHLIESELFGHERGSFTGANFDYPGLIRLAEGGTLFLDEIGDLPLHLQVKLLRTIQEREVRPVGSTKSIPVDVRIISATHHNLEEKVKLNTFRQDLFYRLAVMQIEIAPLRERLDELESLTQIILHRFKNLDESISTTLTDEVLEKLRRYNWPGNIRELENLIERALVLADGEPIAPEHFDLDVASFVPFQLSENNQFEWPRQIKPWSLEDFLNFYLHVTIEKINNKSEAARQLGIDRRTLYRTIESIENHGPPNQEAVAEVRQFFESFEDPIPTISQLEETYFRAVYKIYGHNKSELAALLGIDRRTLYRYLRRWNIPLSPSEAAENPEEVTQEIPQTEVANQEAVTAEEANPEDITPVEVTQEPAPQESVVQSTPPVEVAPVEATPVEEPPVEEQPAPEESQAPIQHITSFPGGGQIEWPTGVAPWALDDLIDFYYLFVWRKIGSYEQSAPILGYHATNIRSHILKIQNRPYETKPGYESVIEYFASLGENLPTLHQLEFSYYGAAMDAANGNVIRAANLLQISRRRVYNLRDRIAQAQQRSSSAGSADSID